MKENKNNTWWGIFRTGNFTDMSGKKVEVDENTIDKIIVSTKNFAYQNEEIPIVIGHPKVDSPKWGAVNKNDIMKQPDKENGWTNLLAKPSHLVDEFSEWLDKKLYENVSIAIRPDWSIKHIGFLGAAAPAVTGLPSIYFSEKENAAEFQFSDMPTVEISSWQNMQISQLLRGVKNYLIEVIGTDKAETLMPENHFDGIDKAPNVYVYKNEPAVSPAFSEKNNTNSKINKDNKMKEKTAEEIAALENENKEFSEKLTTEKERADALAAENQSLKDLQQRNETIAFCESQDMQKKITPALRPVVEGLFAQLNGAPELCFSEGEGEEKKEIKLSPADGLKKILSALPDAVEFSEQTNKQTAADKDNVDDADVKEFAEKNVDPAVMKIHKAALKIQKDKNVDYLAAVREASAQK